MRWHVRWLHSVILVLCIAFILCPISARAAPTHTLTVTCYVEDSPQADRLFDLFHVGSVSETGSVSYQEPFASKGFPDILSENSDYVDLARRLFAYVSDQEIKPDLSEATDPSGNVKFPGLDTGLYLVLGQPYEITDGGTTRFVIFEPVLVFVDEDSVVETKHHIGKSPDLPPDIPDDPGLEEPKNPPKPTGPLPQTGALKWPIPVLAFLCVLCFVLFLAFTYRRKRYRYLFLICACCCFCGGFGFFSYNRIQGLRAGGHSGTILSQMADMPIDLRGTDQTGDVPEAVRTYDGQAYLGVLTIPALGLELPVNQVWNYAALEQSPCRYFGSAGKPGFVICAHNYWTHFGGIGTLTPGSSVTFTDATDTCYTYEVTEITTLPPDAIETMTSADYDLTLFTCTYGGRARVTVRCRLME